MASRPKNMESRIRMDLLYRFRWNLVAALQDVEIALGTSNEETVVRLFEDPSADEELAVPSLSRFEVASAECLDKRSFDYTPEPQRYQPPPSLIIKNADGGSITLRQFVTEVHAYMNEHMDEIKKTLDGLYQIPVDERILFRRVYAVGTDDNDIRLSVSLSPKAERTSLDQFWTTQLKLCS